MARNRLFRLKLLQEVVQAREVQIFQKSNTCHIIRVFRSNRRVDVRCTARRRANKLKSETEKSVCVIRLKSLC